MTSLTWSELRRRVIRLGACLDVVVRSDPEVIRAYLGGGDDHADAA